MKGFLRGTAAALVMSALLAGPAIAQYTVNGGLHDFVDGRSSYNFWLTSQTYGICSSCHVAHHALTTDAPLWNHTLSSATYTMYDNTFSSTIDGTVDAQPTGVSQACLSCHDGTVAVSSLSGAIDPTGLTITGAANIGTDLTHTHPISIDYDVAADGGLVADPTTYDLVLYQNKVQCGSCDDPHYSGFGPMIRQNTAPETLCLGCHIK